MRLLGDELESGLPIEVPRREELALRPERDLAIPPCRRRTGYFRIFATNSSWAFFISPGERSLTCWAMIH